MINVRELRIGNWILINDDIIEVVNISNKGINGEWDYDGMYYDFEFDDSFNLYPKKLEGIPLTEEWLEKFGFVKENELYTIAYNKSHEWMSFNVMLNENGFWVIIGSETGMVNLGNNYEHVHQLQNVFHSIVDVELIIK